jgi:Family of unknown function (DUF6461)
MFMTTIDRYAWIDADPEFDALTLAFVRYGGEPREVLRAGGHTWVEAGRSSFSRALDQVNGFDPDLEPMLFGRSHDWVLLLAPNGYEYSNPGVLAGASRLGFALSVYWNIEAVMRILVAEAGVVRRNFDPLLIQDSEGAPLPEEIGLPFGRTAQSLTSALLLFAERMTGQEITREWLVGEHDLVILKRRIWRDDDPEFAEQHALFLPDTE